MSATERAVIYVESEAQTGPTAQQGRVPNMRADKATTTATAVVKTTAGGARGGSNYVIKIQIGEENMFSPVRIDVSTGGKPGHGHGHLRNLRQLKGPTASNEDGDGDDHTLNSSGQSSP